jgi:hypothetical protein
VSDLVDLHGQAASTDVRTDLGRQFHGSNSSSR